MIDYFETKSQPITRVMVWQAYKVVRANKGAAGVDGMNWQYLIRNERRLLDKLWNRLSSGSYFPPPVRQVEIPKGGGGTRKLGIPTLLDRIAQEVVKHHLEPQLEPLFHPSSYGYRPNRNCHQAVKQAERNAMTHDFVIDLDIKGFFDNIDHEKMMQALAFYCKDGWVLLYVRRWLRAGIKLTDGTFTASEMGTPQGGVISPLLANLFLHVALDKWMEKHYANKPFERYADDIVVHCKTEAQAQYMLGKITHRMQSCSLTLHPVKTKIVNLRGKAEKAYPKGFDFLGFTIKPGGVVCKGGIKAMPGIYVSNKSKQKILAKLRDMELHKWRKPLEEIARAINPVIRGIMAYYQKFYSGALRSIWWQLNKRLLKWAKWEKGLYKRAAIKWLQAKHKEHPTLFVHWPLAYP
jgi:group II intron reverse transcriptase/maturase